MPFWRSWGAALLGASGVALAVPVGLLLVVAIAAGVSGDFAFRDLGQVAAGPALPGSTDPAAAGAPALPTVPRARVRRGRQGTTTAAAPPGSPTPQAGAGGPEASRPAGSGVRPDSVATGPSGTGAGPSTGSVGSGTGTTPPAVPPAPPTTATPDPPAQAVGEVQQTFEPLPVVGPAAADAVGSVAGLILPPGTPPPPTP